MQHHKDERGGGHEDEELVFSSEAAGKTRHNNKRQESHDRLDKFEPSLFCGHNPHRITAAAATLSCSGSTSGCGSFLNILISHIARIGSRNQNRERKTQGLTSEDSFQNKHDRQNQSTQSSTQYYSRSLDPFGQRYVIYGWGRVGLVWSGFLSAASSRPSIIHAIH